MPDTVGPKLRLELRSERYDPGSSRSPGQPAQVARGKVDSGATSRLVPRAGERSDRYPGGRSRVSPQAAITAYLREIT